MSLRPPSNLELAILQLIDDLILEGRSRALNPYAAVKEYLCTLWAPYQFCEDGFASHLEAKHRAVAGTVAFDQVPAVLVSAELAERDAAFQARVGLAPKADVESEVNQAFRRLRAAGLIRFDQNLRSFADDAYKRQDGAIVLLTLNPDHKRIATGSIYGGKLQFHDDYDVTGRMPEPYKGPVFDIRVVDRLPANDSQFASKVRNQIETHFFSWSEAFNNLGFTPIGLYALSGLPMWDRPSPSIDPSPALQGAAPLKSKTPARVAQGSPRGRVLFSSAFLITEPVPCYLVTPEGREAIQSIKSHGQSVATAPGEARGKGPPTLTKYTIDESKQTINFGGRVVRCGGSAMWKTFLALWKARPNTVDVGALRGRKAADVANELRSWLKDNGLSKLADLLKTQRDVGHYFDLPNSKTLSTTEYHAAKSS